MVLLARGNESVLLDLGLVERLYFNSGGLHSADLIFYGLQYWRPTDSVTYKTSFARVGVSLPWRIVGVAGSYQNVMGRALSADPRALRCSTFFGF